MGRVAVLVPSWNGRRHLEECLPALLAQRPPGCPWEVVILDNGSSDGTADWLRAAHPAVRVVESATNLGFAAGLQRLVDATDAERLVFLNNDTRPAEGWLAGLVEALDDSPADVAAVSGRLVDWAGERLDFGRGVMTFDGHAFQLDFGRPLASARCPGEGDELLFACGGNMIVRRAALLDGGGFDADYFAYYEDVDLGWRLWAAGHRVVAAPGAVVHHRSSATSQRLGDFQRGLLFERNAFTTAYKNFDADQWERWQPAVLLTLLARTQTLIAEHNPGGELVTVDPYAGGFADTAHGAVAPGAGAPELPEPTVWQKLRAYGPRKSVVRAVRKIGRVLAGVDGAASVDGALRLTDPRTVAQLRAVSYLLGNLDRAAEKRTAVQARRRRPDAEIFERFPLYLVPTYPGDEALFASPGFRAWLPAAAKLVESTLDELMA